MKITPSESLAAHLKEQNVTAPEGGFLVSDEEYKSAYDLLAQSHSDESPEAFKDRVDYFVIWQNYGVKQNGGATGGELAVGQRVAAVAHRVALLTEVHLPKLAADLSEGVALAKNAMKEGHDKVEAAIQDLKTFEGESHAEVLKIKSELHTEITEVVVRYGKLIVGFLGGILFMLILLALLSHPAHGQSTVVRGASKGTTVGAPVTTTNVDANHTGFDVVCQSGCAGSSGSTTPSNAFANPTTAGMTMSFNAMWNGTSWDLVKGDTTNGLWVNCKTGCAGGSSTPSDAFANPSASAGLTMGFTMLWNGSTWDRVKGDTTNGLWVNCKNGCAGGSSTPSDAFANPTTAGLSQSFTMMWNGATWDRVKGDTTSGLWVNLKNASVAVTGTFWQATQPVSIASMPSTPVTGTFWQATQPISAASLPLPAGAATSAKQPALGTAGTASSDVLTVQGIASMTPLKVDGSGVTQPVSGTVTANQGTANATPWNENISQYNGSAVGTSNPIIVREGDGTNVVTLDACRVNQNLFARISQTANTQIITGTSAKKIYICSINLVTAGANNVAIVEGTGTVCATGIAGVSTAGTTAATGWNFAANGGLAFGSGLGSIMGTATNADNVCILQSAAVQLSGVISYVVQ